MKKQPKKNEDRLLKTLIKELKKSGTICGTGDQMDALRKQIKQ